MHSISKKLKKETMKGWRRVRKRDRRPRRSGREGLISKKPSCSWHLGVLKNVKKKKGWEAAIRG